MAVGPFLTHDSGYLAQVDGDADFSGAGVYAVLVTTTQTPDRATETQYSHISGNEATDADYDPVALASKTVALQSTRIRFNCAKITFTAAGDITARYMYLLYGTAATPQTTDPILGHVDLTGSGNASSVNGEFSYTPHANGLFEILRSAAPA
jgi:hypothetical protein